MMLNLSVEDVMKCRIIDSVAPRTIYITPGAILSMAELANIFYQSFQVNSNQVTLCRLGTGKVAQNRGAHAEGFTLFTDSEGGSHMTWQYADVRTSTRELD